MDAVVPLKTSAQPRNIGVIVDPLPGRARIRHAETGLAGKRIALGVHGLVDRGVCIPADGRVAIDFQRLKLLLRRGSCCHAAPFGPCSWGSRSYSNPTPRGARHGHRPAERLRAFLVRLKRSATRSAKSSTRIAPYTNGSMNPPFDSHIRCVHAATAAG